LNNPHVSLLSEKQSLLIQIEPKKACSLPAALRYDFSESLYMGYPGNEAIYFPSEEIARLFSYGLVCP
jgi:hypothetical protein